MENDSSEEKASKKKSRTSKILGIQILLPIVVIILIAAIFLTITGGIIEIVNNVVGSIIDFLLNPIEGISNSVRKISNWVKDVLNFGSYTMPQPETCTLILSEENIETIKNNISNVGIDLDNAGISDLLLKQIILTNYMSVCTKDTEIAIPISDEEYSKRNKSIDIFEYWNGDGTVETEGQKYISTYGVIEVYNAKGEKIPCYSSSTINQIYSEYLAKKANEDTETANSIAEALANAYTIQAIGTLSMYAKQTTDETYWVNYQSNKKEGAVYEASNPVQNNMLTMQLQNIDYLSKVSNYMMPMELLLNILQITASPEFVIKVSELVYNSQIQLYVYQSETTMVNVENIDSTLETDIYDVKETKTQENGDLKEKKQKTISQSSYTTFVKYAKCWYCEAKKDYKDLYEVTYSFNNENGESQTITKEYASLEEANTDLSIENEILNKVANLQPDTSYSINIFSVSENYQISDEIINIINSIYPDIEKKSADICKKQVQSIKYEKIIKKTCKEQVIQYVDNTDSFVKLLRDDSGKKLKYEDLYNDKATVGDLLVNGSEVLIQLMESSNNTVNLTNVIKYILYKYTDGKSNYDIDNFEKAIYDIDKMQPIDNPESGLPDPLNPTDPQNPSAQSGTILEISERIHSFMEVNGYTYCALTPTKCGHSQNEQCGLDRTFAESQKGYHHACCVTFVSWVLQDAGIITAHYDGLKIHDACKSLTNVEHITQYNNLQPGDIVFMQKTQSTGRYYCNGILLTHVQIFAGYNSNGKQTWYNAGGNEPIARPSPYGWNIGKEYFVCALRFKE